MTNRTDHYCKHCDSDFKVNLHEKETGDFFLLCPKCNWPHYRYFENGIAIHCELKDRKSKPIEVKGF